MPILSRKIILLAVCLLMFVAGKVSAASFELALENNITSSKEDVVVLLSINSADQSVNAAQASISFPASLMSVSKIDRAGSTFSFWIEEPTVDNGKGIVKFVGGSTSAFTGSSLKVLRLVFKVKGAGTGRIIISDGAIVAGDGSGSNLFSTSKGLDINIPSTADFAAVKLETARGEAVLAAKLPATPVVDISFYPDATKWNNRSAGFLARWSLPRDVSQVGVALDKSPNTIPSASAEGLSGNKLFPALTDGIWYFHLRYANNIGWGPTLHYRIAVDTVPPLSFKITSSEASSTPNPTPVISYGSSDTGSGIAAYVISVDGVVSTSTLNASYRLPPLGPGEHKISVVARDGAGNSTAQNLSIKIEPIAGPQITAVTRDVVSGQGEITASGIVSVGDKVVVRLQNSKKQIVVETSALVDDRGNWSTTINRPLPIGDYKLQIIARDNRGASSFPAEEVIRVREKPVLVIGSLSITAGNFYLLVIILLAVAFGGGWYFERTLRGRRLKKIVIAQRDVVNAFDLMRKDLAKLQGILRSDSDETTKKEEVEFLVKHMTDSLDKIEPYITTNINEIES